MMYCCSLLDSEYMRGLVTYIERMTDAIEERCANGGEHTEQCKEYIL